MGTKEGDDMWLNLKDPPGLVMAMIVWLLMLYCDFVVVFIAVEYGWWGDWVIGVYNFFLIMALWSHYKTMVTDPGSVPCKAFALATTRDADTICGRCDAYKPPYSHHCRICGRW
jgi:palmitoyltransferase ZDHHC3/7/25